jgi:hypothetical protein
MTKGGGIVGPVQSLDGGRGSVVQIEIKCKIKHFADAYISTFFFKKKKFYDMQFIFCVISSSSSDLNNLIKKLKN